MLLTITFGPQSADHSVYWNKKDIFTNVSDAIAYGRSAISSYDVFGYAVVECSLTGFDVIDEWGLGTKATLDYNRGMVMIQPPEWAPGFVGK